MNKLKISKYDIILVFIALYLLLSRMSVNAFGIPEYGSDVAFLYNRVDQLRQIILDGKLLDGFFYNDFQGVGYGSSFFYGYLTLIPFTLIKSYAVFCKVYFLVTFMLLYFGTKSLVKRFAKNYEFISFLFMTSLQVLHVWLGTTMYCNFMGLAISFFFLARVVDFARDNKSHIPASLCFWLVLNTHTLSALMSFIGCIFILLYYFKKTRLKDYIRFAVTTTLFCSFFIANFIYHMQGGVLNTDSGYQSFLSVKSATNFLGTSRLLGLEGELLNSLLDKRFLVLSPLIWVPGIYFFIKQQKKTKKTYVVLSLCLLGMILNMNVIWYPLYVKFAMVIQFPLRYMMYAVLVLLILWFRNIEISKKLKYALIIVSCVYSVASPWGITADTNQEERPGWQVSNGEYLHENFVNDTVIFNDLRLHVYDNDKNSYTYTENKGVLTIQIDKQVPEGKILVPKLWYRGYRAYTAEGESLDTRMGYSQFVLVEVGDYQGEIKVFFSQELWLLLLKVFTYFIMLVGITNYRKNTFTKKQVTCYNKS